MRWPVKATRRPNISDHRRVHNARSCSLPSDERCDPRSSDHDLATCIGRLTTSASRPRIPEPKATRHNAVNPVGKPGLSQPSYTVYDLDKYPRSSPTCPRFLTAARATLRLHGGRGGCGREAVPAAFVPSRLGPRSPVGSNRSTTTYGRGRMSGSVCFQSFQKTSGGSTLIRKWCPLRAS